MSVSRMTKVVVAGSSSELQTFMRELQHAEIFHVTALLEGGEPVSGKKSPGEESFHPGDYSGFQEARVFLEKFRDSESFWVKLFAPLRTVKRDKFYNSVNSFNTGEFVNRVNLLKRKIEGLRDESRRLSEINNTLEPWRDIFADLKTAGESSEAFITAGITAAKNIELLKTAPGVDLQILKDRGEQIHVILASHIKDKDMLIELMQSTGFERLDLSILAGSPEETFRNNSGRLMAIESELLDAEKEGRELLRNYDDLILALEYAGNMEAAQRAFSRWVSTPYSFIAAGWIRESDTERFSEIAGRFESVEFDIVRPESGERPPVALESAAPFAPFQLLTKLYSFPSYGSYDPSAVTSVFFAIFFGICLTDAGYGLILALFALWGLRKIGWRSDILWIAFWGGIFTIIAGLLTGGIFGDLFRSENPFLPLPALSALRGYFLWIDPMTEPMSFFRLVLLLGVIHVATGLAIGVFSKVRAGRFADALFDHFTWLVMLISLLSILFASDLSVKMSLVSSPEPPLGRGVILPASYAAGIMALLVFLFGGRGESSVFFRFFIGFLKLLVLSGVFSYLGDILSYIRLMALGMVTAGIATAINTIAFMMSDIPLAGYFLTAVVLALGHTFNLAINVLGGFVHTLRLQYVEFYSKFFTGGGEPFQPLSLNSRYVKIID